MKHYQQPVYNTIRSSTSVEAVPRLLAEFNQNRYAKATVENDPTEYEAGRDPDLFPIESVIQPVRPGKGIVKARAGFGKVVAQPEFSTSGTAYVIASDADEYKYWMPPLPSGSGGTMPVGGSTSTTSFSPTVTYDTAVKANKIVVGFENSEVQPTSYEVFVQYSGSSTWVSAGTNFALNSEGQAVLFYNGSTWSTTVTYDSTATIKAVRLRVYTLSAANAYLGLIELGARLEKDLTPYLTGFSDTFDTGDPDSLSPLGRISSNIATIELFNYPVNENNYSLGMLFNNDNPNSIYYGLIDTNVKFTAWYDYNVGGNTVKVQQFVMYSDDSWDAAGRAEFSVSVRDHSKFLQEVNPPEMLFENQTALKCAVKVLRSVGFRNINIRQGTGDDTPVIPYFWTNGKDSVWSVLDSLTTAFQLTFFFDHEGVLQIMTRTAAFNSAATPVWTVRGETVGNEQDDLAEIPDVESTNRANSITVKYVNVEIPTNGYGGYLREEAWTPPETIVGSSDLYTTMSATDTVMRLEGKEIETWPYEGMVMVEGEIMKFKGKQYGYWDKDSPATKTYKYLETHDQYLACINNVVPSKATDKGFTGNLKITERAMFNTVARQHSVEAVNTRYTILRGRRSGNSSTTTAGVMYKKKGKKKVAYKYNGIVVPSEKGNVTLATSYAYTLNDDWLLMRAGAVSDVPAKWYGTRLMFNKGKGRDQKAGIHTFGSGTRDQGYYIEVCPSSKSTKTNRELIIYQKMSNGSMRKIGSSSGYDLAVVENAWYTLDVSVTREGSGTDRISVWWAGRLITTVRVTSSVTPYGGRFALFTRGNTYASFEYFYAVNGEAFSEDDKDRTFYDLYSKGYSEKSIEKHYILGHTSYNKYKTKKLKRAEGYRKLDWYDEFYPIAHEIMEFDVDFDTPVIDPQLVISNVRGISTLNYTHTPFGAKFFVVNTSRDDEPLEGTVNEIDYKATILGYKISSSEDGEQQVTVTNENSLRVNGKMEMEVSSPWLQSRSAAEKVSEWMGNHWEKASMNITVEIFGNPLIQVGDVIKVEYALGSLGGNRRYFVIAASNSWDNGLTTTLKLRLAA